MKIFARELALSLTCLLAPGIVVAQDLDFKLVNISSGDVVEFYVSHSGTKEWEDNLLDGVYLPSGNEIDVTISDGRSACNYDIRAVSTDGIEFEDYQVDLCILSEYVLEDVAANQAGAAGYESPEAAFAAASSALSRGDMAGFIACLTPDAVTDYAVSLAGMMMMTLAFADMMDASEEAEMAQIKEILARHGLSEAVVEQLAAADQTNIEQKIASHIDDKQQLVADLHGAMALGSNAGPTSGPALLFDRNAELQSLVINGDQASAVVEINQQMNEIQFQRGNSGWLIQL